MPSTEYETTERPSSLKPLLEQPSPEKEPDWRNIGIFATGIAVGAALGASVALLLAPSSGRVLRSRLVRRPHHDGDDESIWDQLATELDRAAAELAMAERE